MTELAVFMFWGETYKGWHGHINLEIPFALDKNDCDSKMSG